MKFILTPNTNPPYNLMRIAPNRDLLSQYGTEEALLEYVIARNKEAGVIAADASCWIVDETELPGGSVSEENDNNYFFDAWEWSD